MTWFKVDDQLPDHRKVRRLGRDRVAAVGLWSLCGSWAAGQLSDGFVPTEIVHRFDPKEQLASALVKADLWHVATDTDEPGYVFHDWAEWQPTREQVAAEREAAKLRQRKARERARSNGQRHGARQREDDESHANATRDVTLNGHVTHAEVPDPVPSRPDPTRPEVPAGTSAGGRAGRREAPASSASGGPPPLPSELGHDPDDERPIQPCGRRHDPEKACRRCRDARLADEQADADADAQRSAADRDAEKRRRECRMCDSDGRLLEVGRFLPVAPAASCDHHTDHRQQVADAKDEPA